MGHVITLSDEQYETITRAAANQGTTPDAVLAQLIESLRDPYTQPRYYELEEWFRHLEGEDAEDSGAPQQEERHEGVADADA